MCGIFYYMAKRGTYDLNQIFKSAATLQVRGPDCGSTHFLSWGDYDLVIAFYRLSIMDLSTNGVQPFMLKTKNSTIYFMCNGEIYNYKHLVKKYNLENKLKSQSDCEILPHLYDMIGISNLYNELQTGSEVSGEFAMIIIEISDDKSSLKVSTMRDMGGVRPLYEARIETPTELNMLTFTSTLTSISQLDKVTYCDQFKPNSYQIYHFTLGDCFPTHTHTHFPIRNIPITIFDEEEAKIKIRDVFTRCVKDRMIADRPIMFMCSGGLDSSLCCGIGAKIAKETNSIIHTMCVGLEGGTDFKYAQMVSDFIGSSHMACVSTQEDYLNLNQNEITKTVESFDTTTNRASTGQYDAARKISSLTDCKVVIIGDYSDEICGGYNETKLAPTIKDFNDRTYEHVETIHYFDAERADRCLSHFGLEARTPFGDHRFITTYLSISPHLRIHRNGVEKYLLRAAFQDENVIPSEVLWRPKEAFSDGISSLQKSWFQILQEHYDQLYTDEQFNMLKDEFYHLQPYTKENLHYRMEFVKKFGSNPVVAKVVPHFWLPKWGGQKDPSARLLNVYNPHEKKVEQNDSKLTPKHNRTHSSISHEFKFDPTNLSQFI